MTYTTDHDERVFQGHTGRVFITLTVLLIIIQLTQRLLPPLLPSIIEDLGVSAFLAGVAISGLRIARASMEYPGGRIADKLSRTTILLMSFLFAITGLLILSIATSYSVLLLAILVFGMGFGLFSPASRALIADMFGEKRGKAFGFHLMGGDFSGVLAAVITVLFLSGTVWRAAFLPMAALLIVFSISFYILSEEPIKIGSIDLKYRATGMRLFQDPTLRKLVVVYSLFIIASSGFISFLPVLLSDYHSFSFLFASSAYALVYVVGVITKPLSGLLSDYTARTFVASACLFVASLGLVLLLLAPNTMIATIAILIYASGQRAVPPALQAFLMDRFPNSSMGGDLGAIRTVYMAVGSTGAATTGLLISTLGYVSAYACLVVFFLGCGVILLRL